MKLNRRQRMDGRKLLARLGDKTADAVFFDPQYRAILDKMKYGNEGARELGRSALTQMSDEVITEFCISIERVLKPSAHLFLWVDKFTLVSAHHSQWTANTTQMSVVDMITWDKGRIGMGRRSRYRSEYLVILQKQPIRAKGCWRDHGIGDNWTEYADRTAHVHSKPIVLQERLIRSTTKRGGLVVDPASGGYSVFEACRASGRDFLGCDIGQ